MPTKISPPRRGRKANRTSGTDTVQEADVAHRILFVGIIPIRGKALLFPVDWNIIIINSGVI